MHRAELDQLEGPSGQPHALLDEEHGAPRVQLDQEPDQAEDGSQDDQSDRRPKEAESPRECELKARRMEVRGKDDAAWRERLEGELSGQALIGVGGVLD